MIQLKVRAAAAKPIIHQDEPAGADHGAEVQIQIPESAKMTRIHVFVEVTKTDQRKIEFDSDQVKGQEVKAAAGVPLENDLARREPGRNLVLVTNDETITIKDGEHFVSLPPGTIS